ncbi:hypothetical protein KM800_06195 [Clostridium tyrobutyricum]|uniref:hypothetical protein n=1 Tax=Clostridium tyrobutyricum TaxID=1519 RepID=UPI001C3801EB|nr:hypothetical protein [Clostridium tyrobutyricum]MBV4418926.1 hypothetical protein [Clostridium tyrobutyricum]
MINTKIEEILLICGYSKCEFFINDCKENIKFEFDNIFSNKEKTEAYIIISEDISEKIMKKYETEILWFQNCYRDNEALIYNINLIILYDNKRLNQEMSNLIFKYERDTHICRKIFINSDSELGELELDVLPFKPLKKIEFKGQEEQLRNKITSIIGGQDIYYELLKPYEELDIKTIRNKLLT